MLPKRCKSCGKLAWRVTGGMCNTCHSKHTQSRTIRTPTATRSVSQHRHDDWPHNHSRHALYDDAPTHHHRSHCDTSSHHSNHDSSYSSSFDSGSCSYDSSSSNRSDW